MLHANFEKQVVSKSVKDVFKSAKLAYEEFSRTTRWGGHGSTAVFWMMYIDNIHTYHNLERSVRTNSIVLYIVTLTPITDLFFTAGHINYCRWLTKFQLDLSNCDETHPGLCQFLDRGAFSVRIYENSFSRVAVDLTLPFKMYNYKVN